MLFAGCATGEVDETGEVASTEGRGCPLAETGFEAAPLGLTSLAGTDCVQLAIDTGVIADPRTLWGSRSEGAGIDCAEPDRHQRVRNGGDPHPTGLGSVQPGDLSPAGGPFRRLTLQDGDWISGERCELGHNEWRHGRSSASRNGTGDGTFVVYRPDSRIVTFVSMRLGSDFPLETDRWQTVLQMKQANPASPSSAVPIIAMDVGASLGEPRFSIYSNERNPGFVGQSFPAQTDHWIRFIFDVYYSADPQAGWIQVSADLNGDGDLDDPGEVGEKLGLATLEVQTSPGAIAEGEAIPSHLRLGIYHDQAIECSGNRCTIDIDNVQAVGAR